MYQPKREHFIAMMNMHYAAADFYAAESERHPFPSKAHEKCLRDAAQALELAEQCRALSKSESDA